MKFGLNFTPVYPTEMATLARVAEGVGYESLWIGEHVLVPFDGVPEGVRANFRADSRFARRARYEDAGVDRLVATPWTSSRAAREGIEGFAADAGLS